MQKMKFPLLFLVAFILGTVYFLSFHVGFDARLIRRAATEIRGKDFVPINDWQGTAPNISATETKRVFYNRVGKCGSRTMIQLMHAVSKQNNFKVIESTRYRGLLHLRLHEQVEFVDFIDHLKAPFVYHHHLHFVEFQRFSSVQPIYINLIRDPLARLVSSYYFRRFGDYRGDRRTWTFKGTDAEKNMTFDECVLRNKSECRDARIFYITPFFCGQETFCQRPSELALKQAKINVIRNYLVVGVTEEFQDFLFVLEKLLPRFFTGVRNIYKSPGDFLNSKIVTTKTMNKKGPSEEVQEIMKKRLALEYDFYNFVKDRFHRLKYELN